MSVPQEDHGSFYPRVSKFLTIVQEMMNEREMEFCGRMEEQNVSILLKEVLKPLTVFYRGGGQQATKETPHDPTP